MDIKNRVRSTDDLTSTEETIVRTAFSMGESITRCSINDLAQASSSSLASIHRLCKKLGLSGFKEFKIELARAYERSDLHDDVDFNIPFSQDDNPETIAMHLAQLYAITLNDTEGLMKGGSIKLAAQLLDSALCIDIYAQSHNLHAARMFADRLLSIGKMVTCFSGPERQSYTALSADERHVALMISYSGAPRLQQIMSVLTRRHIPTILICTQRTAELNPGLDVYLLISDREEPYSRITQYSSHLAIQYLLDILFGCIFVRRFDENCAFLRQFIPYTGISN